MTKLKVFRINFFFALLLLISNSCGIQNNTSSEKFHGEPGKCYAKANIPDRYDEHKRIYPIYTGKDPESTALVQKKEFVIQHKTKRWEKEKSRGCNSPNPKDCYMWCLKEVPQKINTYYIVTDTTVIKKFELKSIYERTNFTKGGFKDWIEVLCQNEVDAKLYANIGLELISRGYLKSNADLSFNSKEIKKAFLKYQKDNNLATNLYSIEALKHIGVLN